MMGHLYDICGLTLGSRVRFSYERRKPESRLLNTITDWLFRH